ETHTPATEYGPGHEHALWQGFKSHSADRQFYPWMYGRPPDGGRTTWAISSDIGSPRPTTTERRTSSTRSETSSAAATTTCGSCSRRADTIRSENGVGPGGFEPPFPDPKSGVLPLDEGPALRRQSTLSRPQHDPLRLPVLGLHVVGAVPRPPVGHDLLGHARRLVGEQVAIHPPQRGERGEYLAGVALGDGAVPGFVEPHRPEI